MARGADLPVGERLGPDQCRQESLELQLRFAQLDLRV